MNPSLYDDAPEGPQTAPGGERGAPPKKPQDAKSATALVPKEFFEGKELKPGDRCEVEIAAIHDEEVSLKYVGHDQEEEREEPDSENAPEPPPGGPPGAPGGGMGGDYD